MFSIRYKLYIWILFRQISGLKRLVVPCKYKKSVLQQGMNLLLHFSQLNLSFL
jgi:hypothetical protein